MSSFSIQMPIEPRRVLRKFIHVDIIRLTVDWCTENLFARSLSFRQAARYIKNRKNSSMSWNECGERYCVLEQCRMLPELGKKIYMQQ